MRRFFREKELSVSGFFRSDRLFSVTTKTSNPEKGAAMKTLKALLIGSALLSVITGCTILEVPYDDHDGTGHHHDDYYVDAYVSIPYEVRRLISDRVDGYSMPPVSRYGYEIYPVDIDDPFNRPSYVSSDFNGDGVYDYAYMFSAVSWDGADWYLDTKMIVVTSTWGGYELSLDLDLGTVTGSADIPVEEYWGIRLLESGIHSVTEFYPDVAIEESVDLIYDGIYLASIDPDERSVFYAENTDVYEIAIDFGAVAKKKAGTSKARGDRVIKLTKSTLKTGTAN